MLTWDTSTVWLLYLPPLPDPIRNTLGFSACRVDNSCLPTCTRFPSTLSCKLSSGDQESRRLQVLLFVNTVVAFSNHRNRPSRTSALKASFSYFRIIPDSSEARFGPPKRCTRAPGGRGSDESSTSICRLKPWWHSRRSARQGTQLALISTKELGPLRVRTPVLTLSLAKPWTGRCRDGVHITDLFAVRKVRFRWVILEKPSEDKQSVFPCTEKQTGICTGEHKLKHWSIVELDEEKMKKKERKMTKTIGVSSCNQIFQ